jgi:uncharacterized protein (DUF1015 family)
VAQVAAVPYDVVNREEATGLASDNPLSFLHISRPEIDCPEESNTYSELVYAKALTNFEKLIVEGPLVQEEKPALYIYRLQMGKYVQTGVAGCFSIDEYDSNLIKKHEKTRREKEDDRTKHMLKLSSQTGPVFLTYRDVLDIDQYIDQQTQTEPLFHFTAQDGVIHTVWKVSEPESLVQLFSDKVPALYIADGHHRAAAASRVRSELSQKNKNHQGNEDYNFVYAVAFPSNQLRILPYHRVIKDLAGMAHNQFLERLESSFHIQIGDASIPSRGEFGMYVGKKWYRISPRDKNIKARLDVSLLQDMVLGPILGISDPRTDKRIDFVGGIRGTAELERLVNSGEAVVAFSIHPTSLKDVMDVSDEGGIMPPKSTWFEPKLRDGILCHRI